MESTSVRHHVPVLDLLYSDQADSWVARCAETPASEYESIETPTNDAPMQHGLQYNSPSQSMETFRGMQSCESQAMQMSLPLNESFAQMQNANQDLWCPWGAVDLASQGMQEYQSQPWPGYETPNHPMAKTQDFGQVYDHFPAGQPFAPCSTRPAEEISVSPSFVPSTVVQGHETPPVPQLSRAAKDGLLVKYKQKGLSYKAIKRLCGFSEAESTLRGRFRTLTKAKSERVRKPTWTATDIRLLNEGVERHTEKSVPCFLAANAALNAMRTVPSHLPTPAAEQIEQIRARALAEPKIPWKKVSKYIADNGGSYQFGNATCKKKWLEIHDLPQI